MAERCGRWARRQYRLREAQHRSDEVSILELASPAESQADIVAREAHRKVELGSRAHGLNAN
jgi:hypothetical protein